MSVMSALHIGLSTHAHDDRAVGELLHRDDARLLTLAGGRRGILQVPEVSVGGFVSRRRAICGQVLPLPLDRRGSVHSCSQYVTRPPFWHTQRTPPSWEITIATDPGSAPASRYAERWRAPTFAVP